MELSCRFEPDMLAFTGCYYGGGEKERRELGEIRKRWITLSVCFNILFLSSFASLVNITKVLNNKFHTTSYSSIKGGFF